MHFWIDKRTSQCGYSGRHRVPPSLSAGVGRGRGRVGVGGGRKPMVTPVHRFQAVECPPRPRRSSTYRYYGPPPMPGVHSSGVHAGGARRTVLERDDSVYVELPEPMPTLQSLAAQRSVTPDTLLRTAAFGLHRPPPLMPPHLKCGMWASFAVATLFVAGAKFYFDHQARMIRGGAGGGEAGVVCAVVGALVACGCALSLCRSRPAPLAFPDRVSSTAHRPPLTPTTDPSDDMSLGALLHSAASERAPEPAAAGAAVAAGAAAAGTAGAAGPAAGEAPPPPYHIAVLLPPAAAPADPPPPAYSAIS